MKFYALEKAQIHKYFVIKYALICCLSQTKWEYNKNLLTQIVQDSTDFDYSVIAPIMKLKKRQYAGGQDSFFSIIFNNIIRYKSIENNDQ